MREKRVLELLLETGVASSKFQLKARRLTWRLNFIWREQSKVDQSDTKKAGQEATKRDTHEIIGSQTLPAFAKLVGRVKAPKREKRKQT